MRAATSHPNNNGERFAFKAVETISLEIPLSLKIPPKPPPAPTISKIPAIEARHPPQNFSICSRLKPCMVPKVIKLTKTAISNAISEVPIKRNNSFGNVFGAKKTSAQLPTSINATGSMIVNKVIPKLGNSRVLLASASTNCFAKGLFSGNLTYLLIHNAYNGPATTAVGTPTNKLYIMVLPMSAW
ncbi:hypothetical protein AMPH_50412 [Acinetobacter baumannii]|nr:hypothetical protein AMPH_50412 [Acinetobacter baumannii]